MGMGWNLPEATSGCNRGAAVEVDAIGQAAVEADVIGEQQLKWTQSGSSSRSGSKRWAAAEADGNGEQHFEADRCNQGAAALHRELSELLV